MLINERDKPMLVIGTGDLGRRIAARLLAAGAQEVRAFSRHPRGPEGAKLVSGDVTEAADVKTAMEGVSGVVIAVESSSFDDNPNGPKRVHYGGVRNIVDAASPGTCIVLISQIYVTRPDAVPGMTNIIRARQQAESTLRSSGLLYTIVRPSWLTDDAGGQRRVRLEQGDTGEGEVSRADVAEACVQALGDRVAQGKTFEMYNTPGQPSAAWHELFAALHPDNAQGGTP